MFTHTGSSGLMNFENDLIAIFLITIKIAIVVFIPIVHRCIIPRKVVAGKVHDNFVTFETEDLWSKVQILVKSRLA